MQRRSKFERAKASTSAEETEISDTYKSENETPSCKYTTRTIARFASAASEVDLRPRVWVG